MRMVGPQAHERHGSVGGQDVEACSSTYISVQQHVSVEQPGLTTQR
jgi:hypothetical protein